MDVPTSPAGGSHWSASAAHALSFGNRPRRGRMPLLVTALFHICLPLIFLRHLRYFIHPVPGFVLALQKPGLYAGYLFPILILILIWRRLTAERLIFISRGSDFLPLILLLAIAVTGLALTLFFPTDLVEVKTWGRGLIGLRPQIPERPGLWLWHLLAVLALIAYFPFSKLIHPLAIFFRPVIPSDESGNLKNHAYQADDDSSHTP